MGSSPRGNDVGFMAEQVVLGHTFSQYFGLCCHLSFHQCSIVIRMSSQGWKIGSIRGGSYKLHVLPFRTRIEIVQQGENYSLFARNMVIFHINIAQYSYTAEKIITQGSMQYIITNCFYMWVLIMSKHATRLLLHLFHGCDCFTYWKGRIP